MIFHPSSDVRCINSQVHILNKPNLDGSLTLWEKSFTFINLNLLVYLILIWIVLKLPNLTFFLGCAPIASLDHFTADKLAEAQLVEEVPAGSSKVVKITGIAKPGNTVSVLMRGSNKLMLDEAHRSLHDALCVIRCLVRKRHLIAGGGAPGIHLFRVWLHIHTYSGSI